MVFSNLFKDERHKFLSGNVDKLTRSKGLFLLQNFKLKCIFFSENHGLFIVYTTTVITTTKETDGH